MKTLIPFIVASFFAISGLHAQVSTSVYAGYGPAKNLNSSAVSIPNFNNGDYALRPTTQSPTFVAGFGLKNQYESGFFMAGELQYSTSSTDFIMWRIDGGSEANPSMSLTDTEHRIGLPLSVGVALGNFNVHSGVNVNFIVSQESGFANIDQVVDNRSEAYMGWHAGLGYSFGPVEVEARYAQDFRNYAQGLNIAGKDIEFYGNRNRFQFIARYTMTSVSK